MYSFTPNLITTNATFATVSAAQSIASKNFIPTGFYIITETVSLYQFSPNISNLGTNDILMNDNGGALRLFQTPNFLLTNMGFMPQNLTLLTDIRDITSYGTHTGTQGSSGSITFPSSNGTSITTDFAIISFNSAITLCNLSITIPSDGNITATFGAAAGDYVFSYLTWNWN